MRQRDEREGRLFGGAKTYLRHVALGVGLVALAMGCSSRVKDKEKRKQTPKKVVLAEIASRKITQVDLIRRVEGLATVLRRRYRADPKLLKKLLTQMVDEAVLVAEAREHGELRGAKVSPKIVIALRHRLETKIYQQLRNFKSSPKEEHAYYEKHRDLFVQHLDLQIRQIVVASRPLATKIAAIVKTLNPNPDLHKRKDNAPSFAKLVTQYSIDTYTKHRGGRLAFAKPGVHVPKAVFQAAVGLKKPRAVAAPVQSSQGWHVIQLLHRRDRQVLAFERVRSTIRLRLRQKHGAVLVDAALAGLRHKHHAKIFAERVVALPARSPRPPRSTKGPKKPR